MTLITIPVVLHAHNTFGRHAATVKSREHRASAHVAARDGWHCRNSHTVRLLTPLVSPRIVPAHRFAPGISAIRLLRRSLLPLATLVAAALSLSCSDAMLRGRGMARIVFEPTFSTHDGEILRSLRTFNLGVTTLRVALRRPDADEILAEQTITVDEHQTEIEVALDVQINGSEELLVAVIEMFSGDVLIFTGSVNVLAKAGADPGTARPQLQLVWVGPGAEAVAVEITPRDRTLSALNGRLELIATARDASGSVVDDPDFVARFRWSVADPTLGEIPVGGGEFVAKGIAGVAIVSVLTPNLLRDTVRFTLQTVLPLSTVSFARKLEVLDRGTTTNAVPVSALDANGTPVSTAQYSYVSRNTQVATVSGSGAITGVARGQAIIVVSAQESGSSTIAQDSLLAVVAEPGAPVLISSVDRFTYARDADITLSIFMDMRSETRALGSTVVDVAWNPAQLLFQTTAAGTAGVNPTINATLASSGQLTLAMASVTGFTGRVELLRVTFRTSASSSNGALTLTAREISAVDFTNLLSATVQVSHPIAVP
jgi:hypothetical protein